MKVPKEKTAAAARDAKRRLENPLTESQKAERVAVEAERQQKKFRTDPVYVFWKKPGGLLRIRCETYKNRQR